MSLVRKINTFVVSFEAEVIILIIFFCAFYQIHLGGDVNIRRETWARIQNTPRDSLFVKELAVAMWGTKILGERSLTGKECPTTKTTRQPLTPEKLNTLKGKNMGAFLC